MNQPNFTVEKKTNFMLPTINRAEKNFKVRCPQISYVRLNRHHNIAKDKDTLFCHLSSVSRKKDNKNLRKIVVSSEMLFSLRFFKTFGGKKTDTSQLLRVSVNQRRNPPKIWFIYEFFLSPQLAKDNN